jgi:small GTP-binding protein
VNYSEQFWKNADSFKVSSGYYTKKSDLAMPESKDKISIDWLERIGVKPRIVQVNDENNLTELDLSSCQLTHLPPEIGQLTHLQSLDLSSNQISQLPPEIGQLTNLQTLNLSSNQLSQLLSEIAQLTNLQNLYLDNNQLSQLLPQFVQLTKLQTLDLSFNQLSQLPPEIVQLTKLQTLDLSFNQLSQLLPQFGQLTNLQYLNLNNNPLKDPPPEIVKAGIRATLEYLRYKQEAGEDTLYEAKLIIVGEGEAGKTTLVKKIDNPDYPCPTPEDSTQGIEVKEWHFTEDNGKDFRVNIWDFGGQEIYHATHQFFFTKRSLYILVADSRKEQSQLAYWLQIIELLSDRSPLLIVKNEKNNRPVEINEPQIKGRFHDSLKAILATNFADNNRGLDEIIKNIKHYITSLPHVGSKLPKTWTGVREALEKDGRNYISLDEYLRICDENGFKRRDDALQLSQFLHDIGVILHFQDDITSLLYKTVIIKPEWGTDAVYKVLDNTTVRQNQGRFTNTDLSNIWHDKQNVQGELLELMMKFKLCYQLPGTNDTYIAPQLLNPNQPSYDWDESDNLILLYEYDFMPKGIIIRFIVEMHRYINEPKVWRSGIILKREDTLAEVVESYNKREIKIRLVGSNKRGFLAVIIDKIDEINHSYHRLQVDKLIPCHCSVCKGSQAPYFYRFENLSKRIANRQYLVECDISFETVDVRGLIEDVIDANIDTGQFAKRQLTGSAVTINAPAKIKIKEIVEINSLNNSDLAKAKPDIYQAYAKADSLEKQNKFREAEGEYKKTIDLEKYYLKAWEGLERIYRILGENEKQLSTSEQVQLIRGIIDFEKNAAQKITLQQLQLTNLDFFGNSSWTFQPQINILLGKNGYGKSHLLRLIISLLQKDDNISSEFFADKLSNASMKLTLERNKAEQVIHRSKTVFEESIGKVPVLAIPDLRYIDKSQNTISLIDNEKGDLREAGAYHFLYQKSFEALIQNFLYELCIMFIDRGRSFELPIFKLLHKVVQELTDEAFKFHEIKPRGNARFEIDVITDGNNDRPLPLQKASQGTLAVLSIFGLIYYYLKSVFPDTPEEDLLNKHALVFIDEVDAHLHPSWQQKIIRLLRKNFPNVQFVVTAHSPLVVAGCLNGEVAVLRRGEGGFVIEEFPEDFIGETTENLYQKLFDIKDIDENYLSYATKLSLNIDNSEQINTLESKETLTDKEAKELEELHRDDYYISRVAQQKIQEKENADYELKISELEAEIRELNYQLKLRQEQSK